MKEKIMEFLKKRKRLVAVLIFGPAALSLLTGLVAGLAGKSEIIYVCLAFMCLIYPVELFIVNIAAFVRTVKYPEKFLPGTTEAKIFGVMDLFTVLAGTALSWFYGLILTSMSPSVQWNALWNEQLANSEVHQPVFTGALPTVFTLLAVGVIGYVVLLVRKMSDTPPLVTVLCMGAMYVGITQIVLFVIQIFRILPFEGLVYKTNYIPLFNFIPLMELPFCCVSMAARLIIRKIYEWNRYKESDPDRYEGKKFVSGLGRLLDDSLSWPVAAIFAMIPLMGVILGLLSLFGQSPDHVIRAWTETAQWNLSGMKAPQNVQYDEHYLCTVAAGGHKRLVRPIRMGERHGHRIVVNRQLLIANAFEQILEEKAPGMHTAIRKFYDTHGYPIARHIKTESAADAVYIIMKPLEWLFLLTLYLVDPAPENRIAVQYLPKEK